MVDQDVVLKGEMLRRPGLHVDGWWDDSISNHGHRQGQPPQDPAFPPGRHIGPPPGTHHQGDSQEILILASDVYGCDAYQGVLYKAPGKGGDCSHLDKSRFERIPMEAYVAWMGHSASFLHESVPSGRDCFRTVVRLNVQQ